MSSATQIARDVRAGTTSALAQLDTSLAAIRAENDALNVFLHVDEEGARAAAQRVDERVGAGDDPGALAGVPIALKDNLCQRGVPTTAGSKILAGWRPPYSATVVDRLLGAGAVPVGKTNMDEMCIRDRSAALSFLPGCVITAPAAVRVPGTVHVTFAGLASDCLLYTSRCV